MNIQTTNSRFFRARIAACLGILALFRPITSTAQLFPTIVAAPPADAPRIDPSRVKFLLGTICSEGGRNSSRIGAMVYGMVAKEVDPSDDLTARQLLQMGISFGQEKCPSSKSVGVMLRSGDPATFKDTTVVSGALVGLDSTAADLVTGDWSNERPGQILGYRNWPSTVKRQDLARAAQARQRDALLEQQRQAAQRVQSEIAARSSAFVKANGVAHFVTIQQLAANPFVYQNQVVAIYGEFQQMNSATQGLFSSNDKTFVVSAIPTARFTQQRSTVMLAGRVLGNIEIKLPVLGPTLVPHLSFVGSAFCQQPGCSEYAFNVR